MAKSTQEKLAERLAQIKELEARRDEITRQLEVLTGLREPDRPQAKPEGFVQGDAIVDAVRGAGKPMSAGDIANAIRKAWNYTVDQARVRSSAKYICAKEPERLAYDERTKRFYVPKSEDEIEQWKAKESEMAVH